MPSRCRNRRSAAGFTLIEVLVALAIAGLALGAVAAVFGTGVIGHEVAADADVALALAEEKLAGAEANAVVRPGPSAGVFAGRYEWRVSVAPYDDPVAAAGAAASTAAAAKPLPGLAAPAALRLYRIETAVAWRDGRRRRQLALSTLRLLPVPP